MSSFIDSSPANGPLELTSGQSPFFVCVFMCPWVAANQSLATGRHVAPVKELGWRNLIQQDLDHGP